MTIEAVQESAQGGAGQPGYARFMPRLRALYIDSIVLIVAGFGILSVAVMLRSDNIARVLGFTIVVGWLLYEPLLVSFAGGTIGHRRTNLRVVDNRTQGNVGLLKSFARSIIKAALGVVSFATMLTTRRSQAIHDLLTRSTVQVLDLALAGPKLYVLRAGCDAVAHAARAGYWRVYCRLVSIVFAPAHPSGRERLYLRSMHQREPMFSAGRDHDGWAICRMAHPLRAVRRVWLARPLVRLPRGLAPTISYAFAWRPARAPTAGDVSTDRR